MTIKYTHDILKKRLQFNKGLCTTLQIMTYTNHIRTHSNKPKIELLQKRIGKKYGKGKNYIFKVYEAVLMRLIIVDLF